MSNFQELQAEKKHWTLGSDEKMFEKLKQMQDNVHASTHLVHNSIGELDRAYNAASTTLNNAINAFNLLSFDKFIENVVEEDKMSFNTPDGESNTNMSMSGTMMGGEDNEGVTEALKIALDTVADAR